MNKKLFKSALFAVAAFVSSIASAQVTYDNTIATTPQTNNALVNPGGSARANDLLLTFTAGTDAPADSEIIIRLPSGLNFTAAPEYLVTPADPVAGLTLKDNTTFGDPTRGDDVGVELFDTDGDDGNDRALVTVSAAPNNAGGDSMTISVRVTANSDATTGLKQASIIVNGGLAETVDLVEVTTTTLTSITSSTGSSLVTVDQGDYAGVDVSTPTFVVVIPAGAENGDTITLDVEGKVEWDAGTSTITVTNIWTPVSVTPLTGTAIVGASPSSAPVAGATSTVTLTVQGAPTGGFTDAVAATLQVNVMEIRAASAVGDYGLTAAGTAGVAGSAKLLSVKENGSSAALTTGQTLTTIVAGSSAEQMLPSVTITENFDDDALAGTATVTFTPGPGVNFGSTATIATSISGGATFASAAVNGTTGALVVGLTDLSDGTLTITIGGIMATLDDDASGTATVTVGGTGIDSLTGPAGDVVNVATGVPVGTVTVAGPTTLSDVGPTATTNTVTLTLSETTYGSISRAAYEETVTSTGTEITRAFFRVTPANADITGVVITATATYTAPGSDPTFGNAGVANNTCVVESAGSDAWICEVVTESTSLTPVTDTVSVLVTYDVDGAVGDVISLTVDGNAGVAGSADVANIVVATEATVSGAIPQVKSDETDAQTLATFTITENFAGGLGTGTFRIIAPAGVVFANAASIVVPSSVTATVSADTFAPNDTLLISTPATPSLTITAEAIIADGVSGYLSFDIVDGNLDGLLDTGLTEESVNLGYAVVEIVPLDAGAAISVGEGFSASNDVTGGIGAKTAASSAEAVATVGDVDGSFTVTGVAAGAATITVTDELGATDTAAVTVTAVTQPDSEKGGTTLSGDPLPAGTSFTAGATTDGGVTFANEFTATDDVTIVATVNVGTDDVGEAGGIHVALKSDTDAGTEFSFLNEDGNFETWDLSDLPGVHIDATALDASYTVTVYSGNLAAGTYRIALAYSSGGDVVYTGKAITLTITE